VSDFDTGIVNSLAPKREATRAPNFGHTDLWTPEAFRSAERYQWIDFARGVGCALVILAHSGFGALGWFWWIMDLFFLASGLLITRTMINLRNRERPLLEFFTFRATRLAPALALLYASYAAASLIAGLEDPPSAILPYALLYQNLDFYIFGHEAFPRIREFDHLWSIVIEEHYYLFWGTFGLVFFLRKIDYRLLFSIGAALMSLSLLVRIAGGHPWTIFTRFDGFVLGSIMAVLIYSGDKVGPTLRKWKKPLYSIYLAIVAFSLVWLVRGIIDYTLLFMKDPEPPKFPSTFWVDVPIYAVLCSYITLWLLKLDAKGVKPRAWAKPAIYFGALSYEAYLFHFPIIWALRKYANFGSIDNWALRFAIAVAVTAAVSAGVHHFLTVPAIKRRKALYLALDRLIPRNLFFAQKA